MKLAFLLFLIMSTHCCSGQYLLVATDTIKYRYYFCNNQFNSITKETELICDKYAKNAYVTFKYGEYYALFSRAGRSVIDDSIAHFIPLLNDSFTYIEKNKIFNGFDFKEGKYYYYLGLSKVFKTKMANDTIYYIEHGNQNMQGVLVKGTTIPLMHVPFLLSESIPKRSKLISSRDTVDAYDTGKITYINQVDKTLHDKLYHCYYFQCIFDHKQMLEWYVTKRIDVFIDTETLLPVQTDYIYEDRVTRVSVW